MRSLYFIFVVFGCMLLITLSKASTTDSQSDNSTEQTTQTTLTTTTTQTEPTSTETTYQATTLTCNCSLYPPTTIRSGEVTQQSTDPETSTINPTPAPTTTTIPVPKTPPPTTPPPTTSPITTTPAAITTTPVPTTSATTTPVPTTSATTTPVPTTSATTTPAPTTITTPESPTTLPPTTTPPTTTSAPTTSAPTTTPAPTTPPTTSTTTKPASTTTTPAPTTPTTLAPTTPPTTSTTTTPTSAPTTSTSAPTTTTPPTTTTKTPTAPPAPAIATTQVNISNINLIEEEVFTYKDDEGNSTTYSHCYDLCNNRMDSTTSIASAPVIVTTPGPVIMTTKKIRQRSVNLSDKTVKVPLVVIVEGNFTAEVPERHSRDYDNYSRQFNESLTDFYQHILGNMFKRIAIHGFSEGSIKCNYTVEMAAPTNETEANALFKDLKEANWTLLNTTEIGAVLEDETRDEQTKTLVNVNIILDNLCRKQEVFRFDFNNNGYADCVYKCDINKTDCGSHGYCVVTYTGDVKCLCKDDKNNVYHGDSCTKTVPAHGPTNVKTESLSRTDIIAIAAGTGGGLVLLLLISLVCVCRKLQSSKKRNKFYSYMGNDKEALHSENSRIENVPNLKNDHTNMAYVRDTDYMQLQRFEPEGKNVNHETGQRQGYERDEKSYRKVEAPDVGNVTIYQPSHLKEPIDRQSGASKFDREEVQSYPFHTMDTEKSYKIRRPTVNSDTSTPYN